MCTPGSYPWMRLPAQLQPPPRALLVFASAASSELITPCPAAELLAGPSSAVGVCAEAEGAQAAGAVAGPRAAGPDAVLAAAGALLGDAGVAITGPPAPAGPRWSPAVEPCSTQTTSPPQTPSWLSVPAASLFARMSCAGRVKKNALTKRSDQGGGCRTERR